jgi:pyruvate/2-oxoglutarate dehydrogenase complex dihydrolipoamide dehydrogenase (E3) component
VASFLTTGMDRACSICLPLAPTSPRRLVCLGAGVAGCELTQAFRRLGCEVDLVGRAERLLRGEAPAVSELLAKRFAAEGVRLRLGVSATKVDGRQRWLALSDGSELAYDALLLAARRRAHVDGLGLEAAGVRFSRAGVEADDHLRTTNPAVYAAGDVARPEKYTHAVLATARLAVTGGHRGGARARPGPFLGRAVGRASDAKD